MNMRPSNVLRKLRAGETVSCVKMNTADPRVVEIAASFKELAQAVAQGQS